MSNAAIITLARSVSNNLSRLWWPLRSGLTDKASWLLWSLAAQLQQSEEELRVARNRVAELSVLQHETAQDRSVLRVLCDRQEVIIARLAGELTTERERCARLILQQQRKVKK